MNRLAASLVAAAALLGSTLAGTALGQDTNAQGVFAAPKTFDAQQERIVELKFFGGLSIDETAEVLGLGHATVERDWKMARAWLRRKLE